MRYNINKKKNIKLTIKNIVILFNLFLIKVLLQLKNPMMYIPDLTVFMNNLYKYRHYVLVILITIWFLWYIKYSLKIKEGIRCWFGRCKNNNDHEKIQKLESDAKKHNYYNSLACYYRERPYYNDINNCKKKYDVKVDYGNRELVEDKNT